MFRKKSKISPTQQSLELNELSASFCQSEEQFKEFVKFTKQMQRLQKMYNLIEKTGENSFELNSTCGSGDTDGVKHVTLTLTNESIDLQIITKY